jgi:serine/threonine protein kinase/Flp pilus assembly protein TadD
VRESAVSSVASKLGGIGRAPEAANFMHRPSENPLISASGSSDRHRDLIAAARQQYDRTGPPAPARQAAPPGDQAIPADFAPGYELRGRIHRGGQGAVYRAVQKSTGRCVAIKILHAGPLAGEHERLRFKREVQVLAQLEHPNIVGIVDSGISSGHAYFVMDYIDGEALGAHPGPDEGICRETADLFLRICTAVSEAHLRGIIHRDLKPSNVLVDAEGQPHILDFGLAKLVGSVPHEGSCDVTMTGQFVGTLPWASPEQAAGRPEQVDIRTDVYSLGVMMYQVLTGEFPYPLSGSLPEALRRIEQAAPIRPRAVNPRIDAEIETIVLKCLAKEPGRRYQSAGELARDLRHYLDDEPLEAKRDSSFYVLRKTLGRHKLATAATLALILLACSSAVAMTVLYRGKVREHDRAIDARDAARRETDKARAIDEFLQNMLAAPDPVAKGRDVKVVDLLSHAALELSGAFPDQPDVEAAVRVTLGRTYSALGLYPEAVEQFDRALELRRRTPGLVAPETLTVMYDLAAVLWMQGELAEAEALMRELLDGRRRVLGDDDPATLEALDGLGAILKSQGKTEESIAIGREVLAGLESCLGPDDALTIQAVANLAFRLDGHGDYAEAEPLLRRAIAGLQRLGRGDEPDTITVMANLANLLGKTGRLEEAEMLAVEVCSARQRLLPPGHALLGDSRQIQGRIAMARQDYAQAEGLFREALAVHRAALPEGSWRTAITQCDLGKCLSRLERYAEAETELLGAYSTLSTPKGEHLPQRRVIAEALAALYEAMGRSEEAADWRSRYPTTAAN